jgi:hypothetical protein
VLGSHKDIESVGELVNVPKSGWINDEYCSCGKRASKCEFWSSVKDKWMRQVKNTEISEYLESYNRLQKLSTVFIKMKKPNKSSEYLAFAEQTKLLYETILAVSEKSIVVDSSKSPFWAYLLSFINGIDLYLVHLVRDGRGVVSSLKKTFKKNEILGVQKDINAHSILRSAIAWFYVNIQSEWVRRQIPQDRSIQIKYEEFVSNPRDVLCKIGSIVGVKLDEVADILEAGDPIRIPHTIAGNRLRMAGQIKLHLDDEWRNRLSSFEKWQFNTVAWPLMKKYHYY